jgi:NAD(P)-dependent dehydrogenase (short-subunit alcohol dehydrogenase family)
MQIDGNVALIVGGTSGLGLATAKRLRAAGATVVLTGRSPERAEKAAAELGRPVAVVCGDLADEAHIAEAVSTAGALGRLAITVVCAGGALSARVLGGKAPLTPGQFESLVRTNLVGTFNVVSQSARAMADNEVVDGERGVVICTSSIAAYDGQKGQAAYAASKAGVIGMTLPLARDLADHAIRVVTIAPGLFDTPMMATLPEPVREVLIAQTPHPRQLGNADDFASLAAHVVENPMLNGEVIRLDGACRLPWHR